MIDRDPWDPPLRDFDCCDNAPARPMSQDTYDSIRDSIKDAYLRDHSRVAEFLDAALSHIGVCAQTGVGPDNVAAARFLEELEVAARRGVPMYEPQEEVL
jgi:hypothetical protein